MSQNLTWQQVPLIRILLPMLCGAGIYLFTPDLFNKLPYFLLLFIFISFLLIPFKKVWPYIFIILMLGLGYVHFDQRDKAYHPSSIIALDTLEYRGFIVKKVQYDIENKRWKGIYKQISLDKEKEFNIYGWVEQTAKFKNLKRGDTLWVESKLDTASPPDIPGEFDFQKYLKRINVPFISYINSSDVLSYAPIDSSGIFSMAAKWRQTQKDALYLFTDSLSANLLNAILFGDSDQLSAETRTQFTESGIAHILAVSGMHVGILILIIQMTLKKIIPRSQYRKWINFITILIFVWVYVSLCDFAASACRAALMASLYFLGKSLKIKASGLNAMAASGLILFLIDPFYLLDLGTQLSFAAMTGILLSFSRIELFFIRKLSLPKKLSSLIAISVAAQIGVAPLIFFYFDQLPLVFWIFSIPAAYFAMLLFAGGWLLVLFQNIWAVLANYLGILITKCCAFFMVLLSSNQYIPLPKIEILYFPLLYVAIAYVLIILFFIIIHSTSKQQIYLMLKSTLVMIVIWNFYHDYSKGYFHTISIEKDEQMAICIIADQKAMFIQAESVPQKIDNFSAVKQAYPINEIEVKRISDAKFHQLFTLHNQMKTKSKN